MDEKISVYYQNCQGLRTKLNTLYMNVLSECYDIIILTETWLIPTITDNLLIDSRYTVFRSDRDRVATGKKDGGGVLVAVRRGLQATRAALRPPPTAPEPLPVNIDCVTVELPSNKQGKRHVLCAIYIPPKQVYNTYNIILENLQSTLMSSDVDLFYVVGDFNLPTINWELDQFLSVKPSLTKDSGPIDRLWLNFLSFMNISQHNYLKNINDRTLDLFCSNCVVESCGPPLGALVPPDAQHPPLHALVPLHLCTKPMTSHKAPRYRFIEADYVKINNDLKSIHWSTILNGLSTEEAINIFYENLYKIIREHVPSRPVQSGEFPIWFSRPLVHLFKNKNRAWLKWKTYKLESDYEIY